MLAEVIEVALRVGARLDQLGVPWVVGGSFASSVMGIPRSTQDIDLVAALERQHVAPFVAAFEPDHYVSAEAVAAAIVRRTCFNLIELTTMTKIDVFVPRADPLSRRQLQRRRDYEVQPGRLIPVLSPEDVILQKLRWYRSGGEVAQQQWRDILGVLATSGPRIDFADLENAAAEAGLDDLLARARGR